MGKQCWLGASSAVRGEQVLSGASSAVRASSAG